GRHTRFSRHWSSDVCSSDLVEADRFIVNIVFAWEGCAAITSQDDAGCLVSHRFPTFTINREALSLEYFRHLIRTEPFRQLLALEIGRASCRYRVLPWGAVE